MLLDRKDYFIREHVSMLKLTDTFDILDPQTQQPVGVAKEEPPGWIKFSRLVVSKQMLPTRVNVYEADGVTLAFFIRRPFTFIRSRVTVHDAAGTMMGYFKSKIMSLGGGFWVYDAQDQQVAEVKGDWKGWDFKFLSKDGRQLGAVTKKWAGLGKELFTSADNYMVSLPDSVEGNAAAAMLLLAAGLAVDIVYKEQ